MRGAGGHLGETRHAGESGQALTGRGTCTWGRVSHGVGCLFAMVARTISCSSHFPKNMHERDMQRAQGVGRLCTCGLAGRATTLVQGRVPPYLIAVPSIFGFRRRLQQVSRAQMLQSLSWQQRPRRGGIRAATSHLTENTNQSSGSTGASRRETADDAAGMDPHLALSPGESCCSPIRPTQPPPPCFFRIAVRHPRSHIGPRKREEKCMHPSMTRRP